VAAIGAVCLLIAVVLLVLARRGAQRSAGDGEGGAAGARTSTGGWATERMQRIMRRSGVGPTA
jgi:hypothetical protein